MAHRCAPRLCRTRKYEILTTETTTAAPVETTPAELATFASIGVLPDIVDALAEVNIVHPFPIQQMSIPIALTGTDMIGQARTGTGKTLAFGITALQRIIVRSDSDFELQAKPGAPQALVVAPTRELALQVSKDLTVAAKIRQARVLTVYGGVGYDTQLDTLASGVEVVVGTPGRLLDLANRGSLDLSHIKVLVLDEADEMLDLGFLPDVERILAKTPELRQTMLFSATMPSAIVALARRHLRHPVNIRAESAGDAMTVPATAQFVYQVHDLDKPEIVARILQAENRNRVMIFCRTKRAAQRLADDLAERGFAAAAIHGDLSQVLREKALKRFRAGTVDVLVATDVAARGIDVDGRHARDQLRVHRRRQDLRAPDRPYRSGRRLRHGDHLRRLGRHDPVEGDQQHPRPAVRGAAGDVLDVGAPLPRPGHRSHGHRPAGSAAAARAVRPVRVATIARVGPPRTAPAAPSSRPRKRRPRTPPASSAGRIVPSGTATADDSATASRSRPAARPPKRCRPRPRRSPSRSRRWTADTASTTPGVEGDAPKRRRRRRRGGSGRSGESADTGGDSGSDGGAGSSDAAASA